jgi:hypothetical protein
MSNSHVQELKLVYEHLFIDASYTFPDLKCEFERDLNRLHLMIESRGIGLFVRDLPALGKHFDRCLANEEYIPSGLPLGKRLPHGGKIPQFLQGLYLLVFDLTGCLKKEPSIEAIFFLRQFLYCAKKAELYCGDDAVNREVDEFIMTDITLPYPEQVWLGYNVNLSMVKQTYDGFHTSSLLAHRLALMSSDDQRILSAFLMKLDLTSRLICQELGGYSPCEWDFKHGPGAISQTTKPTDKYQWYSWSTRLESVYPIADYGFHSYSSWAGVVAQGRSSMRSTMQPSSRLIDVPKTYSKPRLIAAEPSEHQWCQQNIWHFFRSRCKNSWIDNFVRFTDQTLNQELCRKGSVDGSLATVDLSAASDRVTCHVVGNMFSSIPELTQALIATRTQFIKLKRKKDQTDFSPLELRKFSTMGSACTFPVESLIFLSIALASALTESNLPVNMKNVMSLSTKVSVFGDDIIVPKEARNILFLGLKFLYFKVNEAKSFCSGRFRESCGVDAFRGFEVTPAYWHSPTERKPESIASKVDVANNFYMKLLPATSHYLASTLPEDYHIPLVPVDSGAFGIKTFVLQPQRIKTRWNEALQRSESLLPQLIAGVERTQTESDSALIQYFTECPSPYTKWVNGYNQRPTFKIRRRWVLTTLPTR